MEGVIIRPVAGIYRVLTGLGEIDCRARGVFRKKGISPAAGDRVTVSPLADGEGVIEEILPRRNYFIRPNVANIDVICYVASSRFPEPNPLLIDKMTVLSRLKNVEIVLILNKTDLDEDDSARALFAAYEKLGYPVVCCCAAQKSGTDAIYKLISGKTAIFSGNTGVGKSSLLNALDLGVSAKVSEISEKLGRGRHTTREITLYPVRDGGLIGDTPGFGNVDLLLEEALTADNLAGYFPEFLPWIGQCRFADCSHTGERGCILAQRVQSGEIPALRYKSYLHLYKELKDHRRRF